MLSFMNVHFSAKLGWKTMAGIRSEQTGWGKFLGNGVIVHWPFRQVATVVALTMGCPRTSPSPRARRAGGVYWGGTRHAKAIENLSAATIALEISSRNSRVAALQKRWDRMRAGRGLILDQRGADMVDLPGGASGLLVRDYKGKN
jgi:hypothetical protein